MQIVPRVSLFPLWSGPRFHISASWVRSGSRGVNVSDDVDVPEGRISSFSPVIATVVSAFFPLTRDVLILGVWVVGTWARHHVCQKIWIVPGNHPRSIGPGKHVKQGVFGFGNEWWEVSSEKKGWAVLHTILSDVCTLWSQLYCWIPTSPPRSEGASPFFQTWLCSLRICPSSWLCKCNVLRESGRLSCREK